MDEQMKKGVVEMCLLWTISRQENYGYGLIHNMVTAFPDMPERTVYTILRRLLDNGYTAVFTKDISGGPPRKYYRVTDAGREYLDQSLKSWKTLVQAVTALGIPES